MKCCKLLLAAIGATVLLGAAVGSASARILSTSSQTYRVAFASVRYRGPFGTTDCVVTLEGSLHSRTIAKVAGSLIGYITVGALGACTAGTATILRETLPWHVRFHSYTGTLPNITSIRMATDTHFKIRAPEGITCLHASTPEAPAFLIFTLLNRVVTGANRGGTIPSACGSATLTSNSAPVTVLNSASAITVTLI